MTTPPDPTPDRDGETSPPPSSDPDAPGRYVDDEDAPAIPEPNEPA